MSEEKRLVNDEELDEVAGGASGSLKVIGTATVLVQGLNIREYADKTSAYKGQTNAPAKYDVYEIVQNQGYIWYRIALNMWIANDGTWVSFTAR